MQNNTSFNQLIAEKIALLKQQGKYCTVNAYRSLLHLIEREFGVVKCSDCGAAFAMRLAGAMRDKGLSQSTIHTYLACYRAVWNYGVYRKLIRDAEHPIQRYPFELDKPKMPSISQRSENYLTREQMSSLYRHWESLPSATESQRNKRRYLGLFLMSYLCNGANLNDLVRMTYNNDWFNSGGRILSFVRHKTVDRSPVKVRIPVTGWLAAVMDCIADKPSSNGLVLGSFVDGADNEEALRKRLTFLNNYTSRITRYEGCSIGLRHDITASFARHSYSTAMHHMGAPFSLVEGAMGHSHRWDVAFNYIASYSDDALFEWNSKLIA